MNRPGSASWESIIEMTKRMMLCGNIYLDQGFPNVEAILEDYEGVGEGNCGLDDSRKEGGILGRFFMVQTMWSKGGSASFTLGTEFTTD